MTTDKPIISLANVSKAYRIFNHPSDAFFEVLSGSKRHTLYQALSDISFDVKEGEVVGVLGRNGAGKTTLLRLIAETIQPTSGVVKVNGKISPILELGTGFSDEYSGRHNILMGGLCLGLSQHEIQDKFEKIIEFSELEKAIDQPLRTYSTGMRMRLAFSTAIACASDIIIIDEALAVGDALFQAKCMTKLRELTDGGATVFFVSHSVGTIYDLCSRALLLEGGRLIADDLPREVGYLYELSLQRDKGKLVQTEDAVSPALSVDHSPASTEKRVVSVNNGLKDAVEPAPSAANINRTSLFEEKDQLKSLKLNIDSIQSSGISACVTEIGIFDQAGNMTTTLIPRNSYQVRVRATTFRDVQKIVLGYCVELTTGLVLFGTSTFNSGMTLHANAGAVVEAKFSFENKLGQGSYTVGGAVAEVIEGTSILQHTYRQAMNILVDSPSQFEGRVDLTDTIELNVVD